MASKIELVAVNENIADNITEIKLIIQKFQLDCSIELKELAQKAIMLQKEFKLQDINHWAKNIARDVSKAED